MKKQVVNKNPINGNRYLNAVFYLLACSTLLLIAGCEKSPNQTQPGNPSSANTPNLNAQEKALIGKWALKKSETYEISGVDSTGQYLCTLIGSSTCDSTCILEFKNEFWSPQYQLEFKGIGSIGACDSTSSFLWKAKQLNKLEIGSGSLYDIVYLSHDSVAFSNVYTRAILTLKSIVYYKRK